MTPDEKVRIRAQQILTQQKRAELRGLGDVVAAVTKAVGIPACGPCQARQARLNAMVPFKKG